MARRIKPKSRELEIVEEDFSNHMDELMEEVDLINDPVYQRLRPNQKRLIYFLYVQQQKGWTNEKTYRVAYKRPDYPSHKATMRYCETMKRDSMKHCREKVDRLIQRRLEDIPRKVIEEESCLAFSDIAEFFDANGHLLMHPSKLPERVRKSIASLKTIHQKNGNVVYEVSLWNKGGSLSRLQSIFGMNSPEKLELSGPAGGPIKSMNMNYDVSLLSYEDKRDLVKLLEKCRVE